MHLLSFCITRGKFHNIYIQKCNHLHWRVESVIPLKTLLRHLLHILNPPVVREPPWEAQKERTVKFNVTHTHTLHARAKWKAVVEGDVFHLIGVFSWRRPALNWGQALCKGHQTFRKLYTPLQPKHRHIVPYHLQLTVNNTGYNRLDFIIWALHLFTLLVKQTPRRQKEPQLERKRSLLHH